MQEADVEMKRIDAEDYSQDQLALCTLPPLYILAHRDFTGHFKPRATSILCCVLTGLIARAASAVGPGDFGTHCTSVA